VLFFGHLLARFQLLNVVLLTLVCRIAAAAEPSSIEIQLQKPGDTAVIREDAGRTVIVVASETGIGQMTLTSKEGDWPKDVTLRLRYSNGRPFTTLEGFEATASRLQIRSNSRASGRVPFFLADEAGKFSRDDLNPSGWLKLDFKPNGNDLDVIFPSHLWRGEKKLHLQWIDYYRS
jgi:hypothetical protein